MGTVRNPGWSCGVDTILRSRSKTFKHVSRIPQVRFKWAVSVDVRLSVPSCAVEMCGLMCDLVCALVCGRDVRF